MTALFEEKERAVRQENYELRALLDDIQQKLNS